MIPKHTAVFLLRKWGSAEMKEIAKIDYPTFSPSFREYQSGYRTSSVPDDMSEQVDLVGFTVNGLHPALRKTIKLEYLDGVQQIPRRARDASLIAFRMAYYSALVPEQCGGGAAEY